METVKITIGYSKKSYNDNRVDYYRFYGIDECTYRKHILELFDSTKKEIELERVYDPRPYNIVYDLPF